MMKNEAKNVRILLMMKKYYAVKNGRKTGIFESWDECKAQVHGYKCASYKSFTSYEEAMDFILDEKPKRLDPADEVLAYVDGSFNTASSTYGSGLVIVVDEANDEIIKINKAGSEADMASMRNVAGEIIGASMAMDYFEKNIADTSKILVIHYDYTGIENWALGKWKCNKDGTKAYKKRAQDFIQKYKLIFVKVKAHSGDKYNDLADALAKQAAGVE